VSILTDKINALSDIPDAWVEKIMKFQPKLLNEFNRLAAQLTTTSEGFIEMTAGNLTRIETIMSELKAYMTTGEYLEIVTELNQGFLSQEAATIAYFESTFGSAPVTSFASTLYNIGRVNMIETVIGDGLNPILYTSVRDTLLDGIASGSSYSDLIDNLGLISVGNEDIEGRLMRYSRQLVSDTLATTDRQFTEIIGNELGLQWYKYLGGRIKTTRCFCNERNGNYYHRSEIELWGDGVAQFIGQCFDSKYIWQGRFRGTNAETIFSWVGGYNCQHSLLPTSEFDVPKEDIVKAYENGWYKPSKTAKEHFGL